LALSEAMLDPDESTLTPGWNDAVIDVTRKGLERRS